MSSESFHEPSELLSEEARNLHRAIVSLKEELDAVDWYQQRAEACSDDELRAVLVHNKNEEIEHAMMLLEWLRRHSPAFADNVGTYINTSGPIIQLERNNTGGALPQSKASASPSLDIGSMKGVSDGSPKA